MRDGSESPALEVVGWEWRIAILMVQARNDEDDDDDDDDMVMLFNAVETRLLLQLLINCMKGDFDQFYDVNWF